MERSIPLKANNRDRYRHIEGRGPALVFFRVHGQLPQLHIGKFADWDFVTTDQAAQQCLRSNQVYNEWAYSQMLDLNTKPEFTKIESNL